MAGTPRVTDNPAAQRFELLLDGRVVGHADYEVQDETLVITHVVVQQQLEGRGYGSMLTRAVLEAARERRMSVLPLCSFARSYLRRNPEFVDLVPGEQRALVGVPR